jgi:hypothetical protein
MSRPVSSLGTSVPSRGEGPEPDPAVEPGLELLIELAGRQSDHQIEDGLAETPDPRARRATIGSAHAAPQTQERSAWVGPVIVIAALGVLGQAWLGYRGRLTGSLPSSLWYLSLCLIYTPSAALIVSRRVSDQARIWLTLYMSLALLATRFVLYPTQFSYFDELINYRTLLSIQQSKHLFTPNSLLPANAYYPGLEIATSAVHALTGLSLHSAGLVVLAAVRVVMTFSIIRIVERISKNLVLACLAALIYATNPQYVFFNSQFSYQSVALPLTFFCVYLFTSQHPPRRLLNIIPCAAVVVAVAATHHLTSLALVVLLWVWYLFALITRRSVDKLLPLAVFSLAVVAAWTWLARSVVLPYVDEILRDNVANIADLLHGESLHKAFTDPAGDRNPPWEEVLAIASVLILISTLVPALWLAIIKRRLLNAAVLVLFLIAAIYPMIPAGHLTYATAEVGDRASGFVFVGLGYLVATWWFRDLPFHKHGKTGRFALSRRGWLLVLGLTICFVGGTVIDSGPDWGLGPGSYLVTADNRSIDQLALQAAYWQGMNLPPDSRVYTDRVNSLLSAVYGNQHVLTSLYDHISEGELSTLLLAPPSPSNVTFACQAHLEYLIADRRLASGLPHAEFYIDNGEYEAGVRVSPPPLSALTQFDNVPGAERIFDNGAIRIYNLKGLSCAGPR